MNMFNYGVVVGRLAKPVKSFVNKDGSKKVFITIAAQDDFKNSKGEFGVQYVNLEAFVKKDTKSELGVFSHMSKGDMVAVQYTNKSQSYEKNGEMVYDQIRFVEKVRLMESKQNAEKHKKNEQEGTKVNVESVEEEDTGIIASTDMADGVPF